MPLLARQRSRKIADKQVQSAYGPLQTKPVQHISYHLILYRRRPLRVKANRVERDCCSKSERIGERDSRIEPGKTEAVNKTRHPD